MIETILAPPWLVVRIPIVASILGGMLLFFLGSLVDKRFIFPFAKWLDLRTYDFLRKKVNRKLRAKHCAHISESIATVFLIVYCYLNVTLLADYIFEPILQHARAFILPICVGLFALTSWLYHYYELHKQW